MELGTGIYTVSEAARILGRGSASVTKRQVGYWLKSGLSPPSFESVHGKALSFHDLISLEIVRRFRAEGVSLQRVRWLERRLRELHPDRSRPLAYDTFYTDGASIWASESETNPDVPVEIVGRWLNHLVWAEGIRTFADEIRYETETTGAAVAWTPTEWVELDPLVQFGAPVVKDTRIPVATIVANLEAGTPSEVASWYGLTRAQVIGAKDYLAAA
jgi:uncharacterized protein (DUF433 family)/DNA-binding transcriptional MerR regulator